MQQVALKVNRISVSYGQVPILFDFSVEISGGQLVAIVGPNGAGKSTLLKAVLGLVKCGSGSVEFFGQPLKKTKGRVAYVPQCGSFDWDFPMTLFDFVLMGSFCHHPFRIWPSRVERRATMEALQSVDLLDLADRQISQLSCGQRQRAFLARAFVQKAQLYLLDEPFSGIDALSSKQVLALLRKLTDAKSTVIVVHHDLESVERDFDSVILLNKQLIAYGPTEEIFTQPLIDQTYAPA